MGAKILFFFKKMVGINRPLNYLVTVLSAGTSATVESTAVTAELSTCAAVESCASFVVDPEPHAVNVIDTPRAKTKIYFFIILKIHKKNGNIKFQIKNPNRKSGF